MSAKARDCEERCQRIHLHCALRLTRSVAPDHLWQWRVSMPGGHLYAAKGGMSFEEAVTSMQTEGLAQLLAADEKWRERSNA